MRSCVLAIVAGACSCAHASLFSHTYDTSLMPSAQGYMYLGLNSALTEPQVFSVNGGVVTANSMGNGFQGQGSNSVHLGVNPANFVPGQDFVIEARVRVLQGEIWSFHYGFYLGGYFDGMNASIGIMTSTVSSYSLGIVARDNTQWTDWKLQTDRTANVYRIYANGSLFLTDTLGSGVGSPGFGLPQNYFAFGDGTGGANAHAELMSFHAYQIPVPTPGSALVFAVAGTMLARRRRERPRSPGQLNPG